MLLAYTETEYIDKRYNYGQKHEVPNEWTEDKHKLGLDFPNVSTATDGSAESTETGCSISCPITSTER